MNSALVRAVATATLILFPVASNAAQFYCQASTVSALGMSGNGNLVIDMGYGTLVLCTTGGTTDGVTPEVCRNYFALALTARTTGRRLVAWFNTSYSSNASLAVQPGACTSGNFGNWFFRVPYHLDFVN